MKVFTSWNSWTEARNHLRGSLPTETVVALDRAFEYAIACHGEQMRPNGEPYVVHLLQVVEILFSGASIVEKDILVAGVLHDIVEDTSGTLEEISDRFGENVARLVGWLTMPSVRPGQSKKQIKDEYLIQLRSVPEEVIIIKLADRYSNVQRLDRDPRPEKRRTYYREAVKRVLPLAEAFPYFDSLFKEWQKEFSHLAEQGAV